MTAPTLLVLAAGIGSRYGGLKQMEPVGPSGETIMDYSVFDALRAGFTRVVFVLRREMEELFRSRIGARFEGRIGVEYVFQELDDLPHGFSVPLGRMRPWGTAHAVLAARDVIRTPFAVLNADDFYGAGSLRALAGHFASTTADYALVGYTLRNTLSPHGPVARGICGVDEGGFLRTVTEFTAITGDAAGAHAQDARFSGDEIVSMNLWGFTPAVFAQLQERFAGFLGERGDSLTAECYLPNSIGDLIAARSARVRVLHTSEAWAGVTYREDHAHTVEHIAALIRRGVYPEKLW